MSAVHDYLKSWGCCAINLESLEFQQDNVTKANDKLAKVLIEPTVAGSGPIENNNDGMLTAITNLELTPTETIVDQIPAGLIVVNDPYPPREIAKIQPANRYDMSSELLSPDSPGLSIFVVNDDATAPDSVDAIIETSDVLRDPTIQRRQPGTDGLVFAAKFKELANLTLLERDLLGNGVIHLNIAESTDQGVGSYHIPKRMHVPTGVVRLPEEQMRNTSPHYNQPVVPDVINQPFSTNSPTPYQPRPSPSPTFPNATPPNYTNSTHSSGDSYTNNSYGPNGGIPNYPQQRPMLSNQQQQYPMNQFSPQMQPRPNQFVNQNPMPRPQMQQMLVYPQQSRPIMPVRPDYPQRTQFNNQQPFPLGMHPQEQYAQVMGPDGRTFLVPLSQLQFNQNQPPNFVNRPMQGQFPPARQFSQPQFRPAPPNVVVRPQFRPQFQPHYRPNEGQIQPRRN